jgi:flagella basal body P-ring formation protein FlgA
MLGGKDAQRVAKDGLGGESRTVGTGRRRPLPAGRAVVGGFLVAVAAAVVFAASLAGSSKPGQAWAVSARPLVAGTVIGPADVTSATMRLSRSAAALAYRQPLSVEGRTLAVALPAGALIESAVLVPVRQQAPLRPVSVAADPVSLAGLAPGQPVDVLATRGTGTGAAVIVVVRGATLLAATLSSSSALASGSAGQVTIGVASLGEVEAIVQAAHAGTITLVAAEPSDGVGAGPGPVGS